MPDLVHVPQVRPHAHAQRRARELVVNPVALDVKARVFRAGAAKHVGAARVFVVGAVVNEVAIEDVLLLEQQLHVRFFW